MTSKSSFCPLPHVTGFTTCKLPTQDLGPLLGHCIGDGNSQWCWAVCGWGMSVCRKSCLYITLRHLALLCDVILMIIKHASSHLRALWLLFCPGCHGDRGVFIMQCWDGTQVLVCTRQVLYPSPEGYSKGTGPELQLCCRGNRGLWKRTVLASEHMWGWIVILEHV